MLSKSAINTYIRREPRFSDFIFDIKTSRRLPNTLLKEIKQVVAIGRKFNEEVVRPVMLEVDYKTYQDEHYLPVELVEKANEWGFYTMWIPKLLGGRGYHPASIPYLFEELGSACLSMVNLIGAHYLGMVGLSLSLNYKLTYTICQEIIQGEKNKKACICAFAITEPDAGTDTQYEELMALGNLTCHAQKVAGGFKVNGTKVFISNGHFATWHAVIAYSDLNKPAHASLVFLVRNGTRGFKLGKHEKKMGQRGCPASELIFTDCFIPDHQVGFDFQWIKQEGEEEEKSNTSYAFSAAQGIVGSFSAGCARGAFEDALQFATKTKVNGELVINQEWAQCLLSEMYKNATIARFCFTESNLAFCSSLLSNPYHMNNRFLPHRFLNQVVLRFMTQGMADRIRKFLVRLFKSVKVSKKQIELGQRVAGLGSLSKFACSDLAMTNCELALDLMGQTGIRHDGQAEKRLRDARLLQIYEGTNQMNRLNLFKHLIARRCPGVKLYHK